MNTSTATSCVKYLKLRDNSICIQYSLMQETLYILHRVRYVILMNLRIYYFSYLHLPVGICMEMQFVSCEVGTKYLLLFR
jgi:hypothetical protein